MARRGKSSESSPFAPLAPLLGWVLPGLGHWSLGYRKRGLYVGGGILFLYIAGLFIGGIGVINRQEYKLWFFGQVLTGPITPAINWWVTSHPAPVDPAFDTSDGLFATPSYSRMNEIGILYTTIAGMLNLVAIMDLIAGVPAEKKNEDRHREEESARRHAEFRRRREQETRAGKGTAGP